MGSRAVDRLPGRFPWWMDQTGSLLSPGMLPRGVFCRVGVGEKEGIAAFGSRVGWRRQRYGVEEQRDHCIIQPRESFGRVRPHTVLCERWEMPQGGRTWVSHNALLCTPQVQEGRTWSEKIFEKLYRCVNFYKLQLNDRRGIAFSNTKCMSLSRRISAKNTLKRVHFKKSL